MTVKEKDQQLIALLREHARMPLSEIARQLGVSRGAAQSRLQRLERSGVIAGYTVRLSEDYDQGCIRALVLIKAPPARRRAVERQLCRLPELLALHSISGVFDLSALVCAPSVAELDRVIDAIGVMEGVEETQSSVILSTKLERPFSG